MLYVFTVHIGNALLTVATGELGGGQAERAGLVPTHAYAVLNVVEVIVRMYCKCMECLIISGLFFWCGSIFQYQLSALPISVLTTLSILFHSGSVESGG